MIHTWVSFLISGTNRLNQSSLRGRVPIAIHCHNQYWKKDDKIRTTISKKFIDWYLIFHEKSCIDKIDVVKLAWRLGIHKNKLYYIFIPNISVFLCHFFHSFWNFRLDLNSSLGLLLRSNLVVSGSLKKTPVVAWCEIPPPSPLVQSC